MDALIEDMNGGHIIGEKADIHFHRDELHGDVIGDLADGDSEILVHLSHNAVEKTFVQPYAAEAY